MRRHNVEIFSDYFAQRSNVLTAIDARVKLLFVLAVLALVLVSKDLPIFMAVIFASWGALVMIGIPPKMVLARLAAPFFMAGVILLLQGLFFGETPLYTLEAVGFSVPFYREGIEKGTLIAGRVLAGTSSIIFISMTTPLHKILAALKFLRVSEEWLAVLAFAYRYIFVFIEEAQSIMDSQRLRLGYRGLSTGLRSWGTLVGSLFARVFDQAQATHDAMVLRGYNGAIYIERPQRLRRSDLSAGALFLSFFLLLSALDFYWG
ncbi:MAG: cobalt ECF transporter T component CbiQ [Actinobacteria bacterium]|nr:cobalt ECF transporter T component CbiQ [Actinomycetota bacterium]